MTGETDQPLMGTKRTKKKSLIGIDPLAWMNEENIENDEVSVATEEATEADQTIEIGTEIVDNIADEKMIEDVAEIAESEIIDQETKEEEVIDMEMKQEDGSYKLEGPISIADVAELHVQFKNYLAEGNDLEIDCSEVEGVDAAALQLLMAFINEAEKQDNKLIWKEPSDSLQATVLMMGLKDEFKM